MSAALAERGAVVVDADAIIRELQEPGTPVFEAMVERFGPAIVTADGTLDRQAVADIVFADAEALADLNAIVHPAVGAEIARRLEEAGEPDGVVVLDVPLLVESGRDDMVGHDRRRHRSRDRRRSASSSTGGSPRPTPGPAWPARRAAPSGWPRPTS